MSCTQDCHTPSQSQAHCGTCHRTFRSVYGFDLHRKDGRCLDSDGLGFVEIGRVWATPEAHAQTAMLQARMRVTRPARERRATNKAAEEV